MTLPNLLIIGAGRSGTTAALTVLDTHPEVWMHRKWKIEKWKDDPEQKNNSEIHFFSTGKYENGLDWYAEHFLAEGVTYDNYQYIGEKSPSYVNYSRTYGTSTGEKIKKDLGDDVQLVYCVRDPAERAFSQWVHLQDCDYGGFWRCYKGVPFHKAIHDQTHKSWLPWGNLLLQYSDYAQQLSELLKVFDRSQIHIMVNEETKLRPLLEYDKLFGWLGLDPCDISDGHRMLPMVNVSHYNKHGHITDKDREYLNNNFRKSKDEFYNLLGREIKLWEY
jgi:hypothetical protein